MKRAAAVAVGVVLVLAGAAFIAGSLLPAQHRAEASATVPAPPEAVWARLADTDSYPKWRRDVKAVRVTQVMPRRWVEVRDGGDELPLEVVVAEPRQRLVTRIAGEDLPFGGTWTYELTPDAGGGTQVRIVEDGEVYNPVFRLAARLLMDPTGSMRSYLADLEASFAAAER